MIVTSPYTESFWHEYQIDKNRSDYNLVFENIIEDDLDVDRLSKALSRIVEDHILLNSHLTVNTEDQLYWQKNKSIFLLEKIDSDEEAIKSFVHKPFQLDKEPLYRFGIVLLSSKKYQFFAVLHHAVLDGNSFDDFIKLLSLYYNNLPMKKDVSKTLDVLNRWHNQQKDYTEKLKEIGSGDLWKEILSSEVTNSLPYIKSDKMGVGIEEFKIPVDLVEKISDQYSISAFSVLLLGWGILVSRYSNTNVSVINYPIKIKPTKEHQQLSDIVFGSQINVNIISVAYGEKDTFKEVVTKYKQKTARLLDEKNGLKHTYLPIGDIVQKSKIKHLDVGFAQTNLKKKKMTFNDCNTIVQSNYCIDIAGHDIVLEYQRINDSYHFRLKYRCNLFKDWQTSKILGHYDQLLQTLIKYPKKPINQMSILTSSEYQKIVRDWNKTDKDYPKDKTIHQLFEEQVARTPDNTAVVFEDQSLTYRELNEKSNQLARYLRSQTEIKPDTLISLCLDKSLEMIIGILGVLKAGGAYVPIDPKYPDQRIQYILQDTQTKILLTQSHLIESLSRLTSLSLIQLDTNGYQSEEITNISNQNKTKDLAYVIYTSGTTGNPKGTCIPHQCLYNLIMMQKDALNINTESRILQFASISFDASVWEIFSTLVFGAKLYIIANHIKLSTKSLNQYIANKGINIATLSPVILSHLSTKNLECLKRLVTAGDICSSNTVSRWQKCRVFTNAYGPTENTVCTSIHDYQSKSLSRNIGKPITNVKVYILDKYLQSLPVGFIGELYIGGAGLASGYLNQPELTEERFIGNPFATEQDIENGYTRLYKTGDLVRWLPDGNLEYIGRNDSQVKIRGYRIELGEIENVILDFKSVTQAVVIVKEINQEKYLFAYYVADIQIKPENIIKHVANKLPHYMVPDNALQITKMLPLTINGKIDLKALPDIEFESNQAYIAPETEVERLICQAFEVVLEKKKIGINDDFFLLGGNSIKAISLSLLLQANFDISISDIFKMRTPSKMAKNRQVTHNLIISKLEQLKYDFFHRPPDRDHYDDNKRVKKYWSKINNLKHKTFTIKPIKSVLLTGAKGYLGCNILNKLLKHTSYNVYLLIRDIDQETAIKNMENKFHFYFSEPLKNYSSRIHIIKCDLEKNYLGIDSNIYKALSSKIDSIIHCAALAKHYGEYDAFYTANVEATKNLLEFCNLTKLKDFHYISTYSVLEGVDKDKNQYVFTEYDSPDDLEKFSVIYNKTKYLGEIETTLSRNNGIRTNIYRVGNLAFMEENCQVQENIEDNAFFKNLQFLLRIGGVPKEIDQVQISQTDLTAEAIVKIFDKNELSNDVYHVFNPNSVKLSNFLSLNGYPIEKLRFDRFIDKVISSFKRNDDSELIARFLLRMGWQENKENSDFFDKMSMLVLQNKTEHTLKLLSFKWPIIQHDRLKSYNSRLTKNAG